MEIRSPALCLNHTLAAARLYRVAILNYLFVFPRDTIAREQGEKGNYARSNPEIQSVLLIVCQVAVEIHSDILLNENHQLIHDALQSTPEDISFHLEH